MENKSAPREILFLIIDHIAGTKIIMDEDKELDGIMNRLSKLEKVEDWGFYGLNKGGHS